MTEEATSPTSQEEKINNKDVTLDFLIDEREDGATRTDPSGTSPEKTGDHPAVTILDMAVKQSAEYLQKQNLPPANNAVYESFSKPFLNTALWHYLPDGDLPDDPRIALALGVGGLGLAFAPTLIALHQKKEEENMREKQENQRRKEKRTEKENEEDMIEKTPPSPETTDPDWLERLENTGLPGM